MKTFSQKNQEKQSRTLDSQPRAAKQASIEQIIQSKQNNFAFTEGVIQKLNPDGSGMVSTGQNGGLVVGEVESGTPPRAMTLHHIIPRAKLALFWNEVKGQGHINYLIGIVQDLTTAATKRDRDMLELDLGDGERLNRTKVKESMDYMHNTTIPIPNLQNAAAASIQQIFQWWPANIHYGPTSRISPGMGFDEYDENRDDGGDNFEKSAVRVVESTIFTRLERVNDLIDEYMGSHETKHLEKIAIDMNYLARKNITPYVGKKWKKYTIRGTDYYRFP